MSDGGAGALVRIAQELGVGRLLNKALGAFFRTGVGMAMMGAVVVIMTYTYGAKTSPTHALIAAAVSLILCLVGGFMVSIKRALTEALCDAVDDLDLGPKALALVFDRMLEVDHDDLHGDRGVGGARVAENLPLQQAEERLRKAVEGLVKAPTEGGGVGGFVRRKTVSSLVAKIETVTLDEFRAVDHEAGGVDLISVRDRLGEGLDAYLLRMIRSASRKTNTLLVGALLLACGGSAWAVVRFIPA
jgi:hypothetical protein